MLSMGRQKKVDDEDILVAIATSPDPVTTAPELAEKLDYSQDGVRRRLLELSDKGWVESRDVGARATIYWLTPAGRARMN